jgi:1,4-alpha-glucan branching enzyme
MFKGKKKTAKGTVSRKEISNEKKVEFVVKAPEVKEIYLAGDFNGWDTQSMPMKKDKRGIWSAEMRLFPGRYEYKLFSDRAWMESVPCNVMIEGSAANGISDAEGVPNPFGTDNFVFWVR